MLNTLAPQPPDALLALIKQFEADDRSDKIDLGVGVYRDEHGHTPLSLGSRPCHGKPIARGGGSRVEAATHPGSVG